MSGEAGGVLIGGALALAVAPIVIAGAAAVGLAYGAIKIGSFLGRHAINYAAEKRREKELVVNQCSTQLESMYSQMQGIVRDETNAHVMYAQQMSRHYNEIGAQLKNIQTEKPSAEQLEMQISSCREALQRQTEIQTKRLKKTIIDDGKKRMNDCLDMIEKSNREKSELVQWAESGAAAAAMQKNASSEMIRDAVASVRLLDSMAGSSKNEKFRAQADNMKRTLERTQDMFAQKMYQGAFSSARTIIRESAMLASEHVQDEMEMDMLEMQLRAKLEGLSEEMKSLRHIEFTNETRKDKKVIKADLNNFSQGKYKQILALIDERISDLDKASGTASAYDIQKLTEQFDNELEPEARRVISMSQKIMSGYYERLHVLEVVADFMREQDYKMEWAMPVGGDASQKLVVHFKQELTGNTISVTLDNDVDSGDIANMAMEVLTFYESGREVTEEEKRVLRDHLTAALNKAGLGGSLSCQGNVGKPSEQTEMKQKSSVKNLPLKQLV